MIIQTEQFEGPIDLLLRLIEKNELDITRLSLARVADQFVSRMENTPDIPLEHLADFLDIAARLLLLKAKALLPSLSLTDEEEEEIIDLEERLRLHRLYKEASEELSRLSRLGVQAFSREAFLGLEEVFRPDIGKLVLDALDLQKAIETLFQSMPDPEKLREKIVQKTIRLEEKIARVRALLSLRGEIVFFETIADRSDKREVAVSFLAVLELARRRKISIRQDEHFGDVYIRSIDSAISEEG